MIIGLAALATCGGAYAQQGYPIVDTGQAVCYDTQGRVIDPAPGEPLYGQDADIAGNQSRYRDNGDGTISDLVTGLMWEKEMGEKLTFEEAEAKAERSRTGGYDDWRIPTVKELYSLIQFTGRSMGERAVTPYIDTDFFVQPTGDPAQGEREIDAQTWSSTPCPEGTMGGQASYFGVNFVDGRIKGYPLRKPRGENRMYFRLVRGNPQYGENRFVDNGDGTVSDLATGLMWQQNDDGQRYDWPQALQYADTLTLAGHTDWYLPNAKELQSLVDYERAGREPGAPAISPRFGCTKYTLCDGLVDYGYYWSSTSHLDGPRPGSSAVYVCFGRAWGRNPRTGELTDVHGAGAQRSDPKTGTEDDYPRFFGPQRDLQCLFNAVRCVRRINSEKLDQ